MLDKFSEIYIGIEADEIMKEVSMDIVLSYYLSSIGMYRAAYSNLRSALELSMQYIYFIDNNYSYLNWRNNIKDISWSSLFGENGYFLENYKNIFPIKNTTVAFKDIVNNFVCESYRNCSEYIHGKYNFTMLNKTSGKLIYDENEFEKFILEFNKVLNLIFLFQIIRFCKRIEKNTSVNKDEILEYSNEILKEFKIKEELVSGN